ncbi:MAG: phosphate ABC transporter substrate-binding protein PstS [Rhodococcus sp.]|nr:phosphate ABC transporter substrate-binding protein PstS [Rhodococcus sp. (in: high G+C Gram-positive bacteria)]MBJ7321384.1 phosphate ABC transporter substrate-binding protein PstS [Rhodococcus sp. (in: high G+C Gram-positive bacteria)]
MKLKRSGAAVSLMAAGALLLSACGSDNNTEATGNVGAEDTSNVSCGGASALKASGSTAQANAMTRFVNAYEQACSGQTLNYTSNGSGAGVSEFTGGQTDIGGSDSPLSESKGEYAAAAARCGGAPAWNLPVVFGPLAITFNVSGVDSLVLDGPTAAKIFNGTVKTWNDPAIAALNEGVTLPNEPINVIFRSDESGTTDNFQKYLEAASEGAWTSGAGKGFTGGVGEGARGNEGTSAAIASTEGAITYNEWSFAEAQDLDIASIITSAGPDPVEISTETAGKTIDGAVIKGQGNDLVLDTTSFYTPSEAGAYPIVLATYEIVCSKYTDAEVGTAVKAFLQSTIGAGQTGLEENGYIPLPSEFQSKLSTAVNAIS